MRKRGYTLTEALIALGIVGVVSALVLPFAKSCMPDSQKVVYLKTYDSIVSAVRSVSTSPSLYNKLADDGDYLYNTSNYPLLDTYTEKVINGKNCGTGVGSFKNVLREMFKGEDYGTSGNEFVVA